MISRGLKTNSKQDKYVNMLAEDSAECYEDTPQGRDTGLGAETAPEPLSRWNVS